MQKQQQQCGVHARQGRRKPWQVQGRARAGQGRDRAVQGRGGERRAGRGRAQHDKQEGRADSLLVRICMLFPPGRASRMLASNADVLGRACMQWQRVCMLPLASRVNAGGYCCFL